LGAWWVCGGRVAEWDDAKRTRWAGHEEGCRIKIRWEERRAKMTEIKRSRKGDGGKLNEEGGLPATSQAED
jgi:hypothetical protein